MDFLDLIDARTDDIDALVDLVSARSTEDAARMLTMLHEVAKLYVAGQLPVVSELTENDAIFAPVFMKGHIRTSKNLLKALNIDFPKPLENGDVDADGIPMLPLPEGN